MISVARSIRIFFGATMFLGPVVSTAAPQDTLVVKADNPPVWGPAPQLVEELRIGVLEGPEEYVFGRVQGLAVDPSGTIWVADGILKAIRRYGEDGTHLGDLGREGDGPGEFKDLFSIKTFPDGRIVAYDELTHLVSFYDSTGAYIHRVRLPKRFVGGSGDIFQVDTAGHMYINEKDRQTNGDRDIYLRLSTDGVVLDTLRRPPRGYVGSTVAQRYALGLMPTFGTWTSNHISPMGHLVVGRNGDYAFFRPLRDGRTLRIERSWEPIPVKREERAAYQTLQDHFLTRRGGNQSSTRVPGQKPPFWEFWVDDENRIWAARHGEGIHIPETPAERSLRERYGNPPNEWWEPLRFDVIGPNGQFLGLVHFPNRHTKPMVSRGNLVWVLEKGEWDEEYVVRYRIVPG